MKNDKYLYLLIANMDDITLKEVKVIEESETMYFLEEPNPFTRVIYKEDMLSNFAGGLFATFCELDDLMVALHYAKAYYVKTIDNYLDKVTKSENTIRKIDELYLKAKGKTKDGE